jgi:hypothetical protein
MMSDATPPKDDRSIGDLFGELTREITQLVKLELNLAKTEMSHKFSSVGKNVAFLAAGGMIAYAGFLALLAALILILGQAGLPLWASALLVGLLVTAVGGFLVKKGIDAFKKEDYVPHETLESLSGGNQNNQRRVGYGG